MFRFHSLNNNTLTIQKHYLTIVFCMALSLSLIKGGTLDQAGLYAWKKNYKSKTWILKYIFSLPGHHYEHIDRPFNRFSSLGATENGSVV